MSNENQTPDTPELPSEDKPMVIERLRATKEGGVEFVLSLTKEQTFVLINFAVMALVGQGLAVFHDEPPAPAETPQSAEENTPEQELTLGKQLH